MRNLRTEYFIAQRMGGSKQGRGVMERIASLTVAVGVCVMILSVAVIYGFRNQIVSKLEILGSDIKIINVEYHNSLETKPIFKEDQLARNIEALPGVDFVASYAVKGGIFKTSSAMQGVMLKGVDAQYDFAALSRVMVEGELPRVADSVRYKDILISEKLSRMLQIKVGDRVEMMFVGEQMTPSRDRFAVSGVFNSQMDQVDEYLVVTDIRNVQKINQWASNQVTGYEIKSNGEKKLADLSEDVFGALVERQSTQGLMSFDLTDSFPMVFDWLKAHNVNGAVIITIMLIVALFNMISALLIILLERTSMIGLFKAMGMDNGALQRIFLIRSSRIVLRGMIWGNIVGVALCLIQKYTQIIELDAGGYFLTAVPIELSFGWLLLLNAGAFVIICAMMMLPTKMIMHIKPEITLRYK